MNKARAMFRAAAIASQQVNVNKNIG